MDEIYIFFDLSNFIRRDREQRRDRGNIILIIKYLVSLLIKILKVQNSKNNNLITIYNYFDKQVLLVVIIK